MEFIRYHIQILRQISVCGWVIKRGYVPITTLEDMIPETLHNSMKCKSVLLVVVCVAPAFEVKVHALH